MIYIKCDDNPIRAKVWSATKTEKYIDLQISTYRKDKDDKYFYSRWFPRAIGHAANSLKDVKEGDRINIKCMQLTNEPYENKDKEKRSYFKIVITEAEIKEEDAASIGTSTTNESPTTTPSPATEEEDPW